jgi:hypothetical protein
MGTKPFYRCSNCDKEETDTNQVLNWLVVTLVRDEVAPSGGAKRWEFCCRDCLIEYMKTAKQMTEGTVRRLLRDAIAIMDEKGKGMENDTSRVLWSKDWNKLRQLLYSALCLVGERGAPAGES